jgi:chorismate synthase
MLHTLRIYTAGESHGKGLSILIDGLPAGIVVDLDFVNAQLARRQIGFGRGGRMSIERDTVDVLSGVRFGVSTGAPIALFIENRDHKNWTAVMASEGQETDKATEKAFYTPRPGHADLAAAYKYGYTDLRDALERSSARETAARVAAGAVLHCFLKQMGISIVSHVLSIGGLGLPPAVLETLQYRQIQVLAEANDLRMAASESLQEEIRSHIQAASKAGITLGGKIECVALGVPPGLGSHVQWDRKLDGRLAQAMMSIQAVKALSIGHGDQGDALSGDQFHDPIVLEAAQETPLLTRSQNKAGGLEAGITNGMPVVIQLVMKPISTMRKALATVNLKTGKAEEAHFERSDVTAVPACGVVSEAMMAFVIADAFIEKFGGDSISEMTQHVIASQQQYPYPLSSSRF